MNVHEKAYSLFTANVGKSLSPGFISSKTGESNVAGLVATLRKKFGLQIASLSQGHDVQGYRLAKAPTKAAEKAAFTAAKPKRLGRPRLKAKIEPAANQVVVPVSIIAQPGRGKRKNFVLTQNNGVNPDAFLIMPTPSVH